MAKTLSSDVDVYDLISQFTSNCFIGSPNGTLGYAYARVSSDEQARGGSGLVRQLQYIHEVAQRENVCIPADLIYLDDHSGFEFTDRPGLTALRREYADTRRRAAIIVMESLDRLSRNADWHQGYLLEEMKKYRVKPIFWKAFGSRIEQAVVGAISQEGMEQQKDRMKQGNYSKARKGLVPSRRPAYGLMFVDSQGDPNGKDVRKDTHYAINPETSPVVQWIYDQVFYERQSLRSITMQLNEKGIQTPTGGSLWLHSTVRQLLTNPVYKGELVYGRTSITKTKVGDTSPSLLGKAKTIYKKIARPEEDWVIVKVPAIIDPSQWEGVQKVLDQNKQTAARNGKSEYLLTGLVVCAECGVAFTGQHLGGVRRSDGFARGYYRCGSYYRMNGRTCTQRTVATNVLETAVWDIVHDLLINPEPLLDALDQLLEGGDNGELSRQRNYLLGKLDEIKDEDERLWRAYNAEVFDEDEYGIRRKDLKNRASALNKELKDLERSIITPDEIEARKQVLLEVSSRARKMEKKGNIPFASKKLIVKSVVDKIYLDTHTRKIIITGIISGAWRLGTTAETPIIMDSSMDGETK